MTPSLANFWGFLLIMHTTLMCRAKQALWSAQHSVCIPPLNFVRKTVITKCCTVCFGAQQPQEGSETWVTANKVGCTAALAGSARLMVHHRPLVIGRI